MMPAPITRASTCGVMCNTGNAQSLWVQSKSVDAWLNEVTEFLRMPGRELVHFVTVRQFVEQVTNLFVSRLREILIPCAHRTKVLRHLPAKYFVHLRFEQPARFFGADRNGNDDSC